MSTSQCTIWHKAIDRDGYGVAVMDGKKISAHRKAWIEAYGPIPDGMIVMHVCDNPPCYSADHLILGTQQQNVADAIRKNRWMTQRRVEANTAKRKITDEDIVKMKALYSSGHTQTSIARQYGVDRTYVSRIVRNVRRAAA